MRNKAAGAAALGGGSQLTLRASRGIDPSVVDAIEVLWRRARGQLRGGESVRVAGGAEGLTVLPLFEGEELLALLYLDGLRDAPDQAGDLDRVTRFSRTLARSVATERAGESPDEASVETYLERTPVADIQRQKLLLLLERNRWNISCVARLMGVTRRTIYLWLQRFNIPRERVAKTRLRSAS